MWSLMFSVPDLFIYEDCWFSTVKLFRVGGYQLSLLYVVLWCVRFMSGNKSLMCTSDSMRDCDICDCRAEADIVFQKTQARLSASRDSLFTHSLHVGCMGTELSSWHLSLSCNPTAHHSVLIIILLSSLAPMCPWTQEEATGFSERRKLRVLSLINKMMITSLFFTMQTQFYKHHYGRKGCIPNLCRAFYRCALGQDDTES